MTNLPPLWRDPGILYKVYHSLPKSLFSFNTFYRLHFYSFHNLLFIPIIPLHPLESAIKLKGPCHAIFTSDVFHESSSPKPLKITLRSFRILWKFASQGAPLYQLVSTTPGGKFANGVNDNSDKIADGSKGTVSRVFYVRCFHESSSPKPLKITLGSFRIFQKFAEIFTRQGAPLVSTTPVELVARFSACGVDTGGKFAPGVVDTMQYVPRAPVLGVIRQESLGRHSPYIHHCKYRASRPVIKV